MADDLVCRRVVFHGRVQGVGFRMTAARVARRFPVGGTVGNCPDGTVELFAAGTSSDVDAFLEALRHTMSGYIAQEDVSSGPLGGVPTDRFEIVH
jgi:acylphosphatase